MAERGLGVLRCLTLTYITKRQHSPQSSPPYAAPSFSHFLPAVLDALNESARVGSAVAFGVALAVHRHLPRV